MEAFNISNLTFTYPNKNTPAISNINLKIEKGEFLVVCGHSGCGKTTLLRQLKPTIAPHGTLLGNVEFFNKNIIDTDHRDIVTKIGYVLQNPDSQIVTDKVWHELAFGLESLGESNCVIKQRCAEMATFFGIENWYYKNVSELSGGQKQLLNLAAVMTMQPEVLILDEPTAQLDPIAAVEFLSAISRINREIGTTVILSEHRLEESIPLSDRVAVLEKGRLICCDTPENVGLYLKSADSQMFSAMPAAMRIWSSVKTDLKCPITVNEGKKFVSDYLENHNRFSIEKIEYVHCDNVKISASEVFFKYEKKSDDVIKNLNFSAFSGEIFCILGGNGSGKTTTLKLLAGILKAYRGNIVCHGKIGFLPQDPKTVFVKKTVLEDLKFALRSIGVNDDDARKKIEYVSKLCHIESLLLSHPYDLSGGEQQRAALAKILLYSPDILLLDEPTKGLDIPFKAEFASILKTLNSNGVCIVTVSHDIEFCAKYADRCGLFFDGSLVNISSPRDFFSGNSFYTTAANRIAREIEPKAITDDDVTKIIGGKICTEFKECEHTIYSKKQSYVENTVETQTINNKLPLWRRVGSYLSLFSAFAVLIYASKTENLQQMVTKNGMTSLGKKQLIIYAIIIALTVIAAVFSGKRQSKKLTFQTPKEKRKLAKRTVTASVIILLFVPITLFVGIKFFGIKQYYPMALAILTECMLPFFIVFEGKKPQARELVVIASLCALTIAGRAAFFMLPQFKPVMAMTIIAGVAFGGETGFFVGAVSMLVSNFIFSQGPWTPWQMFAMGLIGFLAGTLFKKGVLLCTKTSLCVFGIISAIVIYGGIMNPVSLLIWGGESINFKMIVSYYVTGFPLDAVQAAATALFIWFGAEPMLEKLERIKTKYGLIE